MFSMLWIFDQKTINFPKIAHLQLILKKGFMPFAANVLGYATEIKKLLKVVKPIVANNYIFAGFRKCIA